MSFHDRLIESTTAARDELQSIPIIRRALRGVITREEYVDFLGQAYHHVRHTVPLLMACGARLPARLEWLREAVAEYIAEETGHQDWILDDLAALGESRAGHAEALPLPQTELMVAYAYDSIARVDPLAFFGMVLVLEGTSVALATQAADAIERALGLPRTAFRYLRSHGELDKAHTDFFRRLMDRIEDAEDQRCIVHAAQRFYRLYGDIFRAIDAAAPARAAA